MHLITSIPKSTPENRLVTSRMAKNNALHFILTSLYKEAQRTQIYNVVELPRSLAGY